MVKRPSYRSVSYPKKQCLLQLDFPVTGAAVISGDVIVDVIVLVVPTCDSFMIGP